jgi:lipopolysaccharide O-acetyltransferase
MARRFRISRTEDWLNLLARLKARAFTAFLTPSFGSVGSGITVCPPLRHANLGWVHLGDRVVINRDCWIHTLSPAQGQPPPKLVIGAGCGIGMGSTLSAAREVRLGQKVMLARNVYVSDHAHAFRDVSIPIMDQGIDEVSPVAIEDFTWLGQNVCVLPGVRIGKHCVVGANSVVTGDLPDYSVAVGAPARVVRRYNSGTGEWERVTKQPNSAREPQGVEPLRA